MLNFYSFVLLLRELLWKPMSVPCVELSCVWYEPEATLNHLGAFCMSVSHCPAEWGLSSILPTLPLSRASVCVFQGLVALVGVSIPSLPFSALVCVAQVKACVQISVCNYSDNRAKRLSSIITGMTDVKWHKPERPPLVLISTEKPLTFC